MQSRMEKSDKDKAIELLKKALIAGASQQVKISMADLSDINLSLSSAQPYQLVLVDGQTDTPKYLYIVCHSQEQHGPLDEAMDELAKHHATLSEHDTERFKEPYKYYVTKIIMDRKTIDTLMSLFPPPYKSGSESLLAGYPDNEREAARDLAIYFDRYESELSTMEREEIKNQHLPKIFNGNYQGYEDKEAALNGLQAGTSNLGFITLKGSSLQDKFEILRELPLTSFEDLIGELRNIYVAVDKNDLDKQRMIEKSNYVQVQKTHVRNNKIIYEISMSVPNEIGGEHEIISKKMLEKAGWSPEFRKTYDQFLENINLKEKLNDLYNAYTDEMLRQLYNERFKDNINPQISLTIGYASRDEQAYGIQRNADVLFKQCQSKYLLDDQLRLCGLDKKLLELIPGISYDKDRLNDSFIISHAGGIGKSLREHCSMAWEFGINFQPLDQDANFSKINKVYAERRGKGFNRGDVIITIPLAYIALYCAGLVLDFPNAETTDTQFKNAIRVMIELIMKFNLFVPKRYQEIIYTSGMLSEDDVRMLKDSYEKRYKEEELLCKRFLELMDKIYADSQAAPLDFSETDHLPAPDAKKSEIQDTGVASSLSHFKSIFGGRKIAPITESNIDDHSVDTKKPTDPKS